MNAAEPTPAPEKRRLTDRFLDLIERVGNALPDPTTLFALSALAVIVLSGIAAQFDLAVAHPTTGEVIHPVSLLSVDGLHRILTGKQYGDTMKVRVVRDLELVEITVTLTAPDAESA